MIIATGVLALLLSMVHVLAERLRFLDVTPRSRWLSFSGGVAVGYVFVDILPDLAEQQAVVQELTGGALGFLRHHVYLMALAGLAAFYGLDRAVKLSRKDNRDAGHGDISSRRSYRAHITAFVLYNAMVGYLLLHQDLPGMHGRSYFFFAMAFHFLVNDYGLRQDHKFYYHNSGRWLLSAAVLAGWATGVAVSIPEEAVAVLFALLGGGIMLNVLKEELPEDRESSFYAFLLGAAIYITLMLILPT